MERNPLMHADAPAADCSDNELTRRILAGERAAEFELDRRWRSRLVALARKILRDDALAEDAAQLALWRTARNLGRYDVSRPFEKFIFTIGQRTALDMLRRRTTRHEVDGDGLVEGRSSANPDPHAEAARQEELDGLRHCLDTIRDENWRQSIALKMAGLSLSETGGMLGRSKRVIQGWLDAALKHLRRCMAGRGFRVL